MFWKDALVPNPRPGSPLEPPAGLTQQAHTNFRGAYRAGRAGPLVLSRLEELAPPSRRPRGRFAGCIPMSTNVFRS